MDTETKQFLETEFTKIDKRFDSLENRVDNVEMSLSSKIADLQTTVNRIDKRTDEDIRAVIKDVDKIKKSLKKHKILV